MNAYFITKLIQQYFLFKYSNDVTFFLEIIVGLDSFSVFLRVPIRRWQMRHRWYKCEVKS